jgi:hypothetical protein
MEKEWKEREGKGRSEGEGKDRGGRREGNQVG